MADFCTPLYNLNNLDKGLFRTFAFGNPEVLPEGPGELLDCAETGALPQAALPAPSIITETDAVIAESQFGSIDDLVEE